MNPLIPLFVFGLCITGCANAAVLDRDSALSTVESALKIVAERVDELDEREVDLAERVMCRVRMTTWLKRYGSNPAKAAAWRTICVPAVNELPTSPR